MSTRINAFRIHMWSSQLKDYLLPEKLLPWTLGVGTYIHTHRQTHAYLRALRFSHRTQISARLFFFLRRNVCGCVFLCAINLVIITIVFIIIIIIFVTRIHKPCVCNKNTLVYVREISVTVLKVSRLNLNLNPVR